MEACVFTTNSFTKSLDLSCKTLTHCKRKTKLGSPTSISCCIGDEHGTSDWRSFRARLVGGERSWSEDVGEKWAHRIHEPEKGCLLIATEKLDGVHIFERAVVLVLSDGPLGPSGVILNRPSLMSIKEVDSAGTFAEKPLYFGGPLRGGLFLVGPNWAHQSGLVDQVMEGVYYGRSEMVKRSLGVGDGEQDFRFFDGYCGWEREHLRADIRAGYWTVAASSSSVIGLSTLASAGLWDEVLRLLGPNRVR